jgi:uracil-DNA glycosylase family 4
VHNDTSEESWKKLEYDIVNCRQCSRLVAWREEIAMVKRRAFQSWAYWGKPVPGFGDHHARLLILGLAPGAHGSNRTGRMFTGDSSGETLYAALYRVGFANKPVAESREDGLSLTGAFITAVGRCAPPQNKPTSTELNNCEPFLVRELDLLQDLRVVLALGKIAFDRYLHLVKAQGHEVPAVKFGHGVWVEFGANLPMLGACYHPSRQNTQTGRLTIEMIDRVFAQVKERLEV